MENCCSTECLEITHLPLAEQVKFVKGKQVGNKSLPKRKIGEFEIQTFWRIV